MDWKQDSYLRNMWCTLLKFNIIQKYLSKVIESPSFLPYCFVWNTPFDIKISKDRQVFAVFPF
jgi:hypothetical protein